MRWWWRWARFAAPVLLAAVLSGCAWIDWRDTGRLWIGAACDSVSNCSWDKDGDPMTLE